MGPDERTVREISYPDGDVSPERGVCTDVVVRAYRQLGIDLHDRHAPAGLRDCGG